MKKSILGFILILLLLTTFTPKIEFIENLNFKPYVKSIRIENNNCRIRNNQNQSEFLV